MKIHIKNRELRLVNVHPEHAEWLYDTLKSLGNEFMTFYWSNSGTDQEPTKDFIISKGQILDTSIMDESTRTILLNTIDAHSFRRIIYRYMGNFRFDLEIE